MQRNLFLIITATLAVIASTAKAATVSFYTGVEDPNSMFITNFTAADLDRDNIGGDGAADGPANDGSTYVASDRAAQGQTFISGNIDALLTAVWVQHVGYNGNNADGTGGNTWYAMPANSTLTLRITDPSSAGTSEFVLASETATISGTEENVLPSGTTNTADGTGTYIRIALDEPYLLSANTEYGFDLGAASTFFELSGIRDAAEGGNPYANGTAYTSGSGGIGDNSMTATAGDHVFVLETGSFVSPALNPIPANGATGISFNEFISLEWDAGLASNEDLSAIITNPDIMSHYLYISNANDSSFDSIVPIVINADLDANDEVDPTSVYTLETLLSSDSTYYWKVDEILNDGTGNPRNASDPNNIFGDVWSFATAKQQAQLDERYPLDVAVDAGDVATFTVIATNPITEDSTGLSYQWYKNGAILTGETSNEMSTTITTGDEGNTYYCKVTVDSSLMTIDSKIAEVIFKNRIAYWSFDSDLSDTEGNYDGTISAEGTESHTSGEVNNAISLDGTSDYIELPAGFDKLSGGMTITLWANPTSAANHGRFIDFGNGEYSDNIYFARSGTAATLAFQVYEGSTSIGNITAANAIELNTWQFFAATVDNTGNASIYKNGIKLSDGSTGIPAKISRESNMIGMSNWSSDALYAGMMDEIKIYNYAMTEMDIAEEFYLQRGAFCMEYPTYDISGANGSQDCKVDIYDLSAIASMWLDCGMFPECP